MNKLKTLIILIIACCIVACMGKPDNVTVVDHVNAESYLGTWYEIARLDHSFERGLEQVTATYSKRDDGGIKVVNKGYDPDKKKWKTAEGKAYFLEPAHTDGTYLGALKVSFFGPFYGAYNIIKLDQPYYNYVMLCGPDKDYFWILSRTPQLTYPIKQELIAEANKLGFDTSALINVNQVPDTREFKAGPHVSPTESIRK
jgi:apolipoprotein D and lipocalin family protein